MPGAPGEPPSSASPVAPSEILPEKLYLGCERSSRNRQELLRLAVTDILRVTDEAPDPEFSFECFTYHHLTLMDLKDEDISKHLEPVNRIIEAVIARGGTVLVHCHAGISRSCTLVLAFLMSRHDYSLQAAYAHVKRCRPQAGPNVGFMQQLLEYEVEIHGSTTLSMEDYKVQYLEDLGFSKQGARIALEKNNFDVHRAMASLLR